MDILRVLGLFAMIPIAGWVMLSFADAAGEGGIKLGAAGGVVLFVIVIWLFLMFAGVVPGSGSDNSREGGREGGWEGGWGGGRGGGGRGGRR